MTGFASASFPHSPIELELRSVNHRFLDTKIRGPKELFSALPQLESEIKAALSKSISRGSLELRINLKSESDQDRKIIDTERAKTAYQEASQLSKALGIPGPTLSDLLRISSVFVEPTVPEISLEQIQKNVEIAIDALKEMRSVEGEKLRQILLQNLDCIEAHVKIIRQLRDEIRQKQKTKIQDKIASTLKEMELPALLETRIAQEAAVLLDRIDIEEELQRLSAHLSHFRAALQKGGACGKRLEFLLQELGREINTASNKIQDSSASTSAIEIKLLLEQLREQVLNVE